jgi:hypothetical protein
MPIQLSAQTWQTRRGSRKRKQIANPDSAIVFAIVKSTYFYAAMSLWNTNGFVYGKQAFSTSRTTVRITTT